jgi:hypothetical protein
MLHASTTINTTSMNNNEAMKEQPATSTNVMNGATSRSDDAGMSLSSQQSNTQQQPQPAPRRRIKQYDVSARVRFLSIFGDMYVQ